MHKSDTCFRIAIALTIEYFLRERKTNQRKICQATNIAPSKFSKFLGGRQNLMLCETILICKALNITIATFSEKLQTFLGNKTLIKYADTMQVGSKTIKLTRTQLLALLS